jgi:serine/threonine protein kinase
MTRAFTSEQRRALTCGGRARPGRSTGYYNYKMDMWGVGCVFFELVSLFPLFPGNDEVEQIQVMQ